MGVLKRLIALFAGIYLIILAIGTLGKGASAVGSLLQTLGVGGPASAVGLGWIGAMILMSGSPVASIALTLLDQGALDRFESMGMICGSRLGSGFVILFVGYLHDQRAKQHGKTAYIGAAAFFIAAVLCVPALLVGEWLLRDPAVIGMLRMSGGSNVDSVVDVLMRPALLLVGMIPWPPLIFVLGVGLLLIAFKVLDHALPDVSGTSPGFTAVSSVLFRPPVMFLVGMIVTTLTLSVSVSITVLVPLTAKGYVRRENLFPYIMGANITTFVDTLFVSFIVKHADAFPVVLIFMLCVAAFAIPLVFVAFAPFQHALDRVSSRCVQDPRRLLWFVVFLFVTPLVLLFAT